MNWVVLLDRRDTTVRMEGRTLRVERPGQVLQRVTLEMIGQVVIYPLVSCDVWRKLAEIWYAVKPAYRLPIIQEIACPYHTYGFNLYCRVNASIYRRSARSKSRKTIFATARERWVTNGIMANGRPAIQ